jgi:HTH-type transcriptional regulator, cell division transcriptional repressor
MKKPRNIVGVHLAKLRNEKKLSQDELAVICQRKGWNISRYVIAKIESGSRWVADFEIVLLAESLKVPVPSLFPAHKLWLSKRGHFLKETRFNP